MNFLNAVKKYAESYEIAYSSHFSSEELKQMISAKVYQGTYGLSVQIHLVGGGTCYFPVARDVSCSVGDSVDLSKVTMLVLARGFDIKTIDWPSTDINKLKEEGKDIILKISF